jgi:hypothetical protein
MVSAMAIPGSNNSASKARAKNQGPGRRKKIGRFTSASFMLFSVFSFSVV